MKTVRVLEYGGTLVFNDVPTPTISRDEILVKVKSTAVNHIDLVKASGTVRQILPIDLPWIPGHEFSGVVEQIGSDVTAYAPGDAVFGTSNMGAYAEYLAVKPAAIVRKPSNLSFEEAASVPVASQTAWQGLFTHGHLEKEQTILIHGGAGAVGAYAVQLASHAGATVIATANGGDAVYLTSIGASRVIDYREAQFEKVLQEKVDMVLDSVGGDTQTRSFLVLKEGGHLVSTTQPVSPEETARHRVSGAMMRLAPSADVLGRIARLLEEKTIDRTSRPCIRSRMRPRPGRTSLGTCLGFMGCRPVGRERQDARHTARSCFVSPREVSNEFSADASNVAYLAVSTTGVFFGNSGRRGNSCKRLDARHVIAAFRKGRRRCWPR
jgi:NADPH:quinone reductase-like Zn-dependent oxidoreductase